MQNMDGKLLSGSYEGFRNLQLIPLVIRYAAGVPAILMNPSNEEIALTDVGSGEVTLTLANASLAPLIVGGVAVRPSAPSTLGSVINLKGATTTTALTLVNNQGDDGATESDPVDIHLLLIKMVPGVAA